MRFNELFKKVKVANEINEFAEVQAIRVSLGYENYKWYNFKDYKHFIKVINDEFIPQIVKGLKEAEFEINKEFIVSYQDWDNKRDVRFKVELI